MAERDPGLTLTATSPLGGYSEDIGDLRLEEVTGKALVSAAVPLGKDAAFAKALVKAFEASRPATGSMTTGKKAGQRLLGLQPDQIFILFDEDSSHVGRADAMARDALGDAAYVTDQSDSWAMLHLSGASVRMALERICPLDLSDTAFPDGKVARTVMEHLSVIILRDGPDSFLLMSPRSSAKSFLHAVEVSARNIA